MAICAEREFGICVIKALDGREEAMSADSPYSAYRGRMRSEWADALEDAASPSSMSGLRAFLRRRMNEGAEMYPAPSDYFLALNMTPPAHVKAIILAAEPWNAPGQADGLAFSVPTGVRVPPPLHNMHKELLSDTGNPHPNHGCLAAWAEQGVLLLNAVLTVERGKPGSHDGQGWEPFTDAVLRVLASGERTCVFMAWGKQAQEKMACLDIRKPHVLLCTSSPAPYGARSGFLGSKPFTTCNRILSEAGRAPVDWTLSSA